MTSAAFYVKSAIQELSSGGLVEAADLFTKAIASPDIDEFLKSLSSGVEEESQENPIEEKMAEPTPVYQKQLSLPQIMVEKHTDRYVAAESKSAPSLGHLPGHNFHEDIYDMEDNLDLVRLSSSPSFGPVYVANHFDYTTDDGYEEDIPNKPLFENIDDDWKDPISEQEDILKEEIEQVESGEELSEEEASDKAENLTGEDPSELED